MPRQPLVIGYYSDSSDNLTPKSIDYRLFTHLNHAFAKVKPDGTLKLPDAARSRALCDRAHTAGVKVILSVGGEASGAGFAVATATPAVVSTTANSLIRAAKQVGYDGIDVDWEIPTTNAERDGMNALIRSLRERWPAATLSMASGATNWGGQWFLPGTLLPYLDFINVMTYDFHGPWSKRAGYNAPLFYSPLDTDPESRGSTVDAAADYWLGQKSWPRDKILLGIPLYGHGFRVGKWGDPASGSYARSDVTYNQALALQKQGWKRNWDPTALVPYLQDDAQTELISYDDAQSTLLKGKYARKRGFAGIFFWEISQDFDGRTNPLVHAARSGYIG